MKTVAFVGLFSGMVSLGCAMPIDSPSDDTGSDDAASQEIRLGGIPAGNKSVVELIINNSALCTGFMISRNVILTARHCVPNVATVNVEAYRKIDGSFQCLSRADNTYPMEPSLYPQPTVVNLSNTVCHGARLPATVARHPDTGGGTADDIAVLMNPQKNASSNWLDTGVVGGSENIGIAVNWTTVLLSDISFGRVGDESRGPNEGSGDLRSGVFTRNWSNGAYMIFKASNQNQLCPGDSGSPVYTVGEGNPANFVALVSSADTANPGDCADPGAKQRGPLLGPKLPWIRSVTGRSCPELGVIEGTSAYCFSR